MRPTEQQLRIIEAIKSTVWDWEHTNDLDSPSHNTLLDENLAAQEIEGKLGDQLGDQLGDLLNLIRQNR